MKDMVRISAAEWGEMEFILGKKFLKFEKVINFFNCYPLISKIKIGGYLIWIF
ncbi:hypothetical protein HBE96_19620 [Clostridium sp. P21]|uniref:Uncharacterized protein n=1 Tax=Clostridium muellerianum TaxID=2716538 RepID=A0A7Y0HPA4_9CLOT|nr:hypothetical protein [Clostridium muellerianum]NMM64814.1 hypothetical protein [Clostridium muellerianum]